MRVRLNQAEMALLRVQDGLGLARMALNRLCGLPLDTVFALQEEDLKQTVLPDRMELEEVYANRPEIHSLSLAADIYRRKERIARSEYLPSVALTANYMAMTPSFFDGISNKLDGMWSVGIGVKAPIFHWGASRKSVRSARAETELMELKLEEAKEMVELQVSQAHFKVEEAMLYAEIARLRRKESGSPTIAQRKAIVQQLPESHLEEGQKAALPCNDEERMLIRYLLKFGMEPLYEEEREGQTVVQTVGDYILQELEEDDLLLLDPRWYIIQTEFRTHYQQPGFTPERYFATYSEPEVNMAVADVLSEPYELSKIWKEVDVGTLAERDLLVDLLPKVVDNYKMRRVELMCRDIDRRIVELQSSGNTDELLPLLRRKTTLNIIRKHLTEKLGRTI